MLALVILACAGLDQLTPPSPVPSGRAIGFPVDDAMQDIASLAPEPHPNGSSANARVREQLLARLSSMGLHPRVQRARVYSPKDFHTHEIFNVMARLPGRVAGDKALMLAAHYDSAPLAPGAADDACSVAVLLETMRLLKAAPPLRNDVILLITDGEENWCLGARAFVASDPWAKDVGMVLNFDNRGTRGPVILFETSPGNEAMIRQAVSASPSPLATSAAYEVYRRMPNDTDFTFFRRAGLQGLNFAMLDGYAYYHRAGDTPEHLSPASLAHAASYALPLARRFGDMDLAALPIDRDAVYFNVLRGWVVSYPARWVWPITALALLLLITAAAVAGRHKLITWQGLGGAFLRLVAALGLSLLLHYDGEKLAIWLQQRHAALRQPAFDTFATFVLAAASIAVTIAATGWRVRQVGAERHLLGLLLTAAVLVALSGKLGGMTYLATWPLVFGAAALLGSTIRPAWQRVWALLAAAPVCLLLLPTLDLLYLAVTLRMAVLVAPIAVLAAWLVAAAWAQEAGSAVREIPRTHVESAPQ